MTVAPGHGLRNEGAPFTRLPGPGRPQFWRDSSTASSTAGEGRAICSCGSYSTVLPTAAARKSWHREHKSQKQRAQERQR